MQAIIGPFSSRFLIVMFRLASVISLELFHSRPLNLHLLYLVCAVNIIFCVVLCFILFSGLS
jgi:hypothetical protein